MGGGPTVLSTAELAASLGVKIHAPEPPTEIFYTRAGRRLHGLDWGGTGPGVLLLHGGGLSAHTWDFVCLGLRGAARLVALDLRGHGDSDWSDDYRVATMADDVIAAATTWAWLVWRWSACRSAVWWPPMWPTPIPAVSSGRR